MIDSKCPICPLCNNLYYGLQCNHRPSHLLEKIEELKPFEDRNKKVLEYIIKMYEGMDIYSKAVADFTIKYLEGKQ